jgi:threonine dehydrogenase-like Zn-dependent dehydrogenase
MRELTFLGPGSVEWRDVPEPTIERPDDALVRPLAVALCDLDTALLRGQAPFQPPLALGHEFVAEVVEVGPEANGVRAGDRVVVPFQPSCGTCARCRAGLTSACEAVPTAAMYGVGQLGGDFGGALADLVRVPFAPAMLRVPLPDGIEPAAVASVSDNVADGWRTVAGPLAERPGAPVLVVGGAGQAIGLYAVQTAVGLGAERVDDLDADEARLGLARELGANAIEGPPPRRTPERYPIVVDVSGTPEGLHCALRSTEPGGVCTSAGIYFGETTPIPLFEMYVSGITFATGRVDSLAVLPEVLDLVARGVIDPARVTSRVVGWDDALDALADPPIKLVVAR